MEELKRQLALQQQSAAKQLQEVIEAQKTEMQRQSVVYERQVEAIRQEMNRVKEHEKQRVASIKAIPVSSAKTAGAAEAASRHTANAVAILRFTVF